MPFLQRTRVTDADFDEVSTVDLPANQHGLIVLAKSADPQEDTMPAFVDDQGNELQGQLVQDTDTGGVYFQTADGELLDFDLDSLPEGDEYDGAQERELESVGKSAFLDQVDHAGQQFFGEISSELSKALDDVGRDSVIAKAIAQQQAALVQFQAQATRAEQIAKAAEDREQERLFISKATEYEGLGVAPEVLGPIMKRMTEALPREDCQVLAGIFERQGDIFKSFGVSGGAEADSPLDEIEAYANEHGEELAKSYRGSPDGRSDLSKEQSVVAYFDSNPRAYSEMKRGR